eukprot:scaffold26990_cov47-Attheya_sp.AAC.3
MSSLQDDHEEDGMDKQWPVISSCPSSTTVVSLDTADFQTALERYLDETKPDPMARRQAESLVLEWIPVMIPNHNNNSQEESTNPPPPERHHAIQGTLQMTGEYMTASIEAHCRWCDIPVQEEETNTTTKTTNVTTPPKTILVHRRLHFELRVSASFVPLSKSRGKQTKKDVTADAEATSGVTKNKGQAKKIRAAMIKRLTADSYIQKLLMEQSSSKSKQQQQQQQQQQTPPLLCEAHIDETIAATVTNDNKETANNNTATLPVVLNLNHSNGGQKSLEERVHVSEDMLEALRRCIWSHNTTTANNTGPHEDTSGDVLSILEWVLAMPYLPRKKDTIAAAAGPSQTSHSTTMMTSLADRAYLRLLEDALWDECEKEGDNDLLNDLTLSNTDDNDSSDEDEERNNNTKRRRKVGSS